MPGKQLLISLLALALAACGVPTVGAPSVDAMATQVASTLTAMAPVAHSVTESPPASFAPEPTVAPPPAPLVLRIAYTSAGNVWLAEGDAPPVQLTTSGSAEQVRISSDGQRIVFSRRPSADGPVELRAVNRDGSGETVLAASGVWNGLYPTDGVLFNDVELFDFIPGTHQLLLNTRGVPEGPGLMRYDDLLRLDAESGALTTLRAPEAGGGFLVSPDGTKLAIIQHERISLAHIDGTPIRSDAITFPSVITYSEYLYHPVGQWTADSSAVGFAIPSADPLAADAGGTIWRLPADGGPAVTIATIAGDFFFTQFDVPALSPDLAWVAFQRGTTAPNIRNLIVARADGTGETIVAAGQPSWAGWSPDSSHFVFGLDDPMNLQLGAPGTAPAPLVNGTRFRWVDATTFVYTSGHAGAWMLMRGSVGAPAVAIASPAGDFVDYDTAY
jgi:hypothetical protein